MISLHIKCVNSLKQGKACGTDNSLNEYLLEAGDILLSYITDLFNAILDSGCFPDNWTGNNCAIVQKR